MRILFVSGSPLAGVAELMTRLINECYPGEHEARCLAAGLGKHGKWYTRQGVQVPRYSVSRREDIDACLEWAEVVHCNANVGARNLGRPDLLGKKVWVFTWHGAEINGCLARSFKPEDYRHVRFIHIGQGWIERQADFFARFDLTVLPNLIAVDDEIHRPLSRRERTMRIAFAPSTLGRGVNCKGVPETQKALRGYPLDTITGEPFEKCMRRKQRARIGIDEVFTGMYHRSGLEFLAQGTPCVAGMQPAALAALKEATGAVSNPFFSSSLAALRERVDKLWSMNDGDLDFLALEARDWIDRHYHPRVLLPRYFDLYRR